MPRIKEKIMKTEPRVCSNPSCGRVFVNALRTQNVADNSESYDACPYCLTAVVAETSTLQQKTILEESTEPKDSELLVEGKIEVDSPTSPSKCSHHLGYLSERTSKGSIPDECIMCEKIVQCMLKKVTGKA